ncbi:DUF5004 domain-containing protein [Zunongwangia sp. F363]|uniref:DUF5004 domain-containing protein n=1 Tax=Autumnicola tepida TaxID=3075595 RepID=A0ABU3CB25_9FLAO|nr:lipocalin family protein [Zunongwangia sp. F363]MDT0643407.1 DUF5004 domain-containing protein [Zunongwangia sp. F363]
MMKKLMKISLLTFMGFGGILSSCEANQDEMMEVQEAQSKMFTANASIESNQLVGRWELVSMTSDVAVNLNDGEPDSSTNILEETDCFNKMYFEFFDNGALETGQAKLDFSAASNGFSCESGVYFAQYDINNEGESSKLDITFDVDGMTVTETKNISLSSNENGEFLTVTLTASEVDQANYINDGRENTVVGDITSLETVYKKI